MPLAVRALLTLLLLVPGPGPGSARAEEPSQPGQQLYTWSELAGTRPCHVRVLWWSEPESSGTVSWSTAEETEESFVELRERGGEDLLRFDSARDGLYSGSEGEGGAYFHHAPFRGLSADTTYELVVESDGARSREFYFRTAPVEDEAFTLLYGGDARTIHENRLRMNRLVRDRAESEPELLAFVHGGDYVMDGRYWSQWRLWLSHHEVCTASDGRLLPLVPARGNHDWGPLYDEVFDAPGGAGRNYGALEVGPELALMTLNTNISTAGEQAEWMAATLPRLRDQNRWLLVQYHRPMYPAVKLPSEAKPVWVPMFEENDVDLVMESDGHVLKRTVPIRGEAFDPTGVTYIGEGGLGAPLRRPRRDPWYLQPPGMVSPSLHVSLLDVAADGLTIRTLGPAAAPEEFEPVGARVLLGEQAAWRWTLEAVEDPDWRLGRGAAAAWDSAPPAKWGARPGVESEVQARAWVQVDGERLREARELGLRLPRGVAATVWLDGVEVARRGSWREGNPWDLRDERYGERLEEFVPLVVPASDGARSDLVLALELLLDPGAAAGVGPRVELLADPERGAEDTGEPPILDLWRLAPRRSLAPR